jgi:hypothetical protein
MLAILCKPQDEHGEGGPEKPLTNDPPFAIPSKPPQYSEPPNGCFPLQLAMVRRGQVYVSFQLSDLREIRKDLSSYTDAQSNTPKPFSL